MSKNENTKGRIMAPNAEIAQVVKFLEEDEIRFHLFEENSLELFMQAKNLTMRLVIYHYNDHLILRVPYFIRNVNLKRFDILLFLTDLMNEFLDIRFEISPDGQSLSASCQHVLEDSILTRKQFDFLMMIILHVVDDSYLKFMKLLYADEKTGDKASLTPPGPIRVKPESSEEIDEKEAEKDDEDIKIN